jgi:spore maturation protein CgeB
MRIGVIGSLWPDAFSTHIVEALSGMGHEAVALGSSLASGNPYVMRVTAPLLRAVPALDQRQQRRLVRSARDRQCEIVISVEATLMPETVAGLRRDGARVALWFPDPLIGMDRQLMLLAPYDALFVKDPYLVERLRSLLDLPVTYLPEACNPRVHRPLATPGTDPYLVLAGNMYPSRMRLLERLHAAGVPLRLYGPGFPRWAGDTPLRGVHAGRLIFNEEKARIFGSATAVVNTLQLSEIRSVNARLFEAAGSGAAILTEFRPALAELFEPGHEVLAFRDFDELVALANRLLGEAGLSEKLGDAARRRAHQDHTYEQRLDAMLQRLC